MVGVRRDWLLAHITLFSLYNHPIWKVLFAYIDKKTGTQEGILKTYQKKKNPYFPKGFNVLAEPKPVASAPLKHAGGHGFMVLSRGQESKDTWQRSQERQPALFWSKTTVVAKKMV